MRRARLPAAAGDAASTWPPATSRPRTPPPRQAAAIGERFGDADLLALARPRAGPRADQAGAVEEGLALLDEAMVAVTTGELSPIVTGLVYCSVIDCCQQRLRARPRAGVDRGADALVRRSSPTWSRFTRPLPRAPRGDHAAAAARGRTRWRRRGGPESASRRRRTRGAPARRPTGRARSTGCGASFAAAEEAYRDASRAAGSRSRAWRCCAWRRGRRDAAAAAIRRRAGRDHRAARSARGSCPPTSRSCWRPATRRGARSACRELERDRRRATGSDARSPRWPRTRAGRSSSPTGTPGPRSSRCASACRLWHELDAPYEAARARVLVGLACRALGDEDSADAGAGRGPRRVRASSARRPTSPASTRSPRRRARRAPTG